MAWESQQAPGGGFRVLAVGSALPWLVPCRLQSGCGAFFYLLEGGLCLLVCLFTVFQKSAVDI